MHTNQQFAINSESIKERLLRRIFSSFDEVRNLFGSVVFHLRYCLHLQFSPIKFAFRLSLFVTVIPELEFIDFFYKCVSLSFICFQFAFVLFVLKQTVFVDSLCVGAISSSYCHWITVYLHPSLSNSIQLQPTLSISIRLYRSIIKLINQSKFTKIYLYYYDYATLLYFLV